jgi:hypothetical protein
LRAIPATERSFYFSDPHNPENVVIVWLLTAHQQTDGRVGMRFVIAAFVALAAWGSDFETLANGRGEDINRIGSAIAAITDANARPGNASDPAETTDDLLGNAPEEQADASDAVAEQPEKNFCEALLEAADSSDIPVAFFARLLWQESRFRSLEVSPVGAQGIAQFMPTTAAEVGLDDPFDPFKALPASAKYLRRLRNQFGNLGLAAAAYNAGSGRIQKWLSGQAALPQETKDYVRRITGTAAENWAEESKTVSLRLELPADAPCEGVGGLSRANGLAAIPVALTPFISEMFKKAKAEAQRREMERRIAVARKGRNQVQPAKQARQFANIRDSDTPRRGVISRSRSSSRVAVLIRVSPAHPNDRRVRVASAASR